jgi:predicted hydrocarbon binding protein
MEDEILGGFVKETREWEMQVTLAKHQLDTQKQDAQAQRKSLRQGFWRDIQKALQEGNQDIAKQLARELGRRGISAEEIAGDTGLPLEEVGKLLPKVTFTQEEWQEREEKHQFELLDQAFLAKQEGLRTGVKIIARNFKALGLPIVQIAQGTGLTEQQINGLKENSDGR